MTTRVAVALVTMLAAAGLLAGAGCTAPAPAVQRAPFELPVGRPSYDVHAPSWAVGGVIRVGADSVEVRPPPVAYVVTGSGIYYTDRAGRLWFTAGGPAEAVAPIGSFRLVPSADGRLLGLLDYEHDRTDDYGEPLAVPVVFDLRTGEQVLRAPFRGSLEGVDLRSLYGEVPPYFAGFAAGAAFARDGLRHGVDATRYPLSGGVPHRVPEPSLPPFVQGQGTAVLGEALRPGSLQLARPRPRRPVAALLSPDGGTLFVTGQGNRGVYYDAASGDPIEFDHGGHVFVLGGWLSDDVFYGVSAERADGESVRGRARIVRCSVVTAACAALGPTFTATRGESVLFGTGDDVFRVEAPPVVAHPGAVSGRVGTSRPDCRSSGRRVLRWAVRPRLVCRQGPPDFESGLAT